MESTASKEQTQARSWKLEGKTWKKRRDLPAADSLATILPINQFNLSLFPPKELPLLLLFFFVVAAAASLPLRVFPLTHFLSWWSSTERQRDDDVVAGTLD